MTNEIKTQYLEMRGGEVVSKGIRNYFEAIPVKNIEDLAKMTGFEQKVMQLNSQGKSTREILTELIGISYCRSKNHRRKKEIDTIIKKYS